MVSRILRIGPATLILAAADAATAPPAAGVRIQVVAGQGVAIRTVRLARLLGRETIAAQHVLAVRNRLQVIRAAARTRTIGPMIKLLAVRDGADQQLVNEHVGGPVTPTVPEAPVAIVAETRRIGPVTVGLGGNLRQEPFSGPSIHTFSIAQGRKVTA